jgi:hypothetical protein
MRCLSDGPLKLNNVSWKIHRALRGQHRPARFDTHEDLIARQPRAMVSRLKRPDKACMQPNSYNTTGILLNPAG